MRAFAKLLDQLYFTSANNAKRAYLLDYFRSTPDPDRGFALAALAGTLDFDLFKRGLIRELIEERVDPTLFAMSYDYVGEISETVAHLWPTPPRQPGQPDDTDLPSLSRVIDEFRTAGKADIRSLLADFLDRMNASERWALLKLGTRGLRVGVSARFAKKVVAEFAGVDVHEVEEIWHALAPPYEDLFAWAEGRAPRPSIEGRVVFHPVMLAHPLEDDKVETISPDQFAAEWKYDGIRVQLVGERSGSGVFSRTGDDISGAFPDIRDAIDFRGVVDGELLIIRNGEIGSFQDLQTRLGRKSPSAKMIAERPAGIMLYDALNLDGEDIRPLPFRERRIRLEAFSAPRKGGRFHLSPLVTFESVEALAALRAQIAGEDAGLIEGLMLKRWDAPYLPGRPTGQWYKWKRDPLLLDAVLMYAQRGHGKRSSFYSDYTFGLWKDDQLLPIGKAYFGFSDDELKQLDKWVRAHAIGRFGPVREVEKALVFEVAFDSAHRSKRHKSGFALRFPRISRIRWDKPAHEADQLSALETLVGE
ncbi:MAG: cisplatin damage response ATP-dependent DNA ligase [Pseudomonadota bacterium]